MKRLFQLLLLCCIVLPTVFFACKKSNIESITSAFSGQWTIQVDSFYSGVGIINHTVAYVGKSGDYFNFSPRGQLYISENSAADTLSYSLVGDSLIIRNFRGPYNEGRAKYDAQSPLHLVIKSQYLLTPGGILGRTVYLIR